MDNRSTDEYDVIIVGAGIAGIMCARTLAARGYNVLMLDKDRSVGGRMATRRIAGATVDHGAQFFTVRDDAFGGVVSDLESRGTVVAWTRSYVNDEGILCPDGQQRYRGHPSMNAIAKTLAESIPTRTESRVSKISADRDRWTVHTQKGSAFESSAVALTPPVPQVLSLLEESGIDPGEAARTELERVDYAPCIAVLAVCGEPHPIPGPGAVQLSTGPIGWIADNYSKGISPQTHALTIHATGPWSRQHYDDSEEDILKHITEHLRPWLDLEQATMEVKRWRYARAMRRSGVPDGNCSLRLETSLPLYCAGDGFSGARVEAAALSGMDAGERICAELSR